MKERPILFSGPMVRAILEGRKPVTRRAVKGIQIPKEDPAQGETRMRWSAVGQRDARYGFCVFGETEEACAMELGEFGSCPHGRPGERLWVRETFALLGNEDGVCIDWNDNMVRGDERRAARIYRASCEVGDYGLWQIPDQAFWKPDTDGMHYEGAWRASIHMPRWVSRILLEITAVRVERLHAGEGETAFESRYLAEGINRIHHGDGEYYYSAFRNEPDPKNWCDPFDAWRELWVSINGVESWDANPWVWVVEFNRLEVANG